jgi:tRNA threonylcarbamoyladenosine biosynthesis protein TsaE
MNELRFLTSSESGTAACARDFAKGLAAGDVVLLYGELGAGKTAFTRGIVQYFDPEVTTTSPTFSLVNVYPTKPAIYHYDLYRIQTENELVDIGLEEYFDGDGIVVIEWAEKCRSAHPARYLRVELSIISEDEREILIEEIIHDHSGR